MSGGADQAIERVIAKVALAVDQLVGKEHWVNSAIQKTDDIADLVVFVFEILPQRLAGQTCLDAIQATVGAIVFPIAHHTVAQGLFDFLAFGVVSGVFEDVFYSIVAADLEGHLLELSADVIA